MGIDDGIKPRKTPKQKRSQETVTFILEAAAQVFGEKGYKKTTTNHIAERAGVSIGTIYQYFPNKDALLLVLAEHHISQGKQRIVSKIHSCRTDASAEQLLRILVDEVISFHHENRSLNGLIYDEAPRNRELLHALQEAKTEIAQQVPLFSHRDPKRLLKSIILVDLIYTLIHEVVLQPPAGFSTEDCKEEVIRICLTYLKE
ncbi:TetR/AcrR family transcriptional regulator [Desmospora activa]|uniref:TetR family transcriptional regulator n=1 Tax=Desmospora activa DSM 45169 TaxID=1121389 RepID=A0A2T4ZCY9_9BACL|nr:TetR/AcrR family transcriptional regulator [Desmospora activa]PTM59764.1 TetR family transcriptional regulator [Desmospora activa DSM 45169]